MVGGIGGPVGGFGGAQARPAEARLSKHDKVDKGDIVDQNKLLFLRPAMVCTRAKKAATCVLILSSRRSCSSRSCNSCLMGVIQLDHGVTAGETAA